MALQQGKDTTKEGAATSWEHPPQGGRSISKIKLAYFLTKEGKERLNNWAWWSIFRYHSTQEDYQLEANLGCRAGHCLKNI